ncbi:hypothetical protein STANM309S_01130 [Streptomyces tanashiensis]
MDRPNFQMYEKGTQFQSRSNHPHQRNYLGIVPCKVSLHYRRATEPEISEGVIVYEICVEVDGELLEALAKAILVSAIIAALAALAAAAIVIFGGGVLGPAVLVLNSPMGGSIGPDSTYDPQDVRYVQALVNDWRATTGGSLVAIDGAFSEETAGALSDFQSAAGLEDTAGSLAPGDATETELASTHLNNLMAAADLSEFQPTASETSSSVRTPTGSIPSWRRNRTCRRHSTRSSSSTCKIFATSCSADHRALSRTPPGVERTHC